MSETTCPNCAATLPSGAAFCTSCGHRMSGESSPPQPPGTDDATRVDSPAVSDATQTYSPPAEPQQWAPPSDPAGPSGPAAPWQPAESGTSTPPPAAPPTQPAPPPAAPPTQPAPPWQQAQAPGAPQQPGPPQQWGAPAPAPAPGQGARRSSRRSPIGAIVALVGGILALVGLFTAWVGINVGDMTTTGWGMVGGKNDLNLESNDPYILLALGVAALVIGVLMFTGTARILVRAAAGVIGLVIIGIAIRDWLSIADLATDLPSEIEITAQFGFYLTIAGGVVTAIAAVMPNSKSS